MSSAAAERANTDSSNAQLGDAVEAGSRFVISPGLSERVADAAAEANVAFLPGVATAGDVMRGLDLGLDRFKFFPAKTAGGIAALKALSAPFANVRFCPTGGIRLETAGDWLALDSVLCVGGSWFVKPGDDLDAIAERARTARALAK